MKCFIHEQTSAVGVCKNCNRGVCNECVVEVAGLLACKDRCEEMVQLTDELMKRAKGTYKQIPAVYNRNAVIYVMFALGFFGFGVKVYLQADEMQSFSYFLMLMGVGFLVAAYLVYSVGRKGRQ